MIMLATRRRSAFTLIEILVTTMVMLIMVLAMSQMFALVGQHVSDGRAVIELQGALRNAGFRVQEDLDGLTILARQSPESDWEIGYFEYIEGANTSDPADGIGSDLSPRWLTFTAPNDGTRTAYGDIDDAIMFTARSTGRPFVGRIRRSIWTGDPAHNNQMMTIESHDAEIIYWTEWNPLTSDGGDGDLQIDLGEVTLHRRVLLIRPDLNVDNMPSFATMTPANLKRFYNQNDLSVHPEPAVVGGANVVRLKPNSLADLARRENRVAHLPPVASLSSPGLTYGDLPLSQAAYFPNYFVRDWLPPKTDVLITDVLAFDVRAYDPLAPLRQGDVSGAPAGDLLRPGDYGWSAATHTVGQGAFVDLAYDPGTSYNAPRPWFFSVPHANSGLYNSGAGLVVPTYDTWTWAYEHDGIDQDNDGVADEATDGVDNDGANGVDDAGERETRPPYAHPLRGIQITLRVIELDTRQVRQTSIVSKLMPQ